MRRRNWTILSISVVLSSTGIFGAGMMPDRSTQASQPSPQPSPQVTTPIPELSSIDRQKLVTLQLKFQRQQWQKLALGDRIQIIAEQFIGDPYRANLLDQSNIEQPFVSLHEFDCVLFLETVLAVTSALSSDNAEITIFPEIQRYRYRDGKLNDYCDRLHYFSDWVLDNQRRGLIKDVGTVPLKRSLNFMSQNWNKYSPIVRNPALKNCIQTTESLISQQLQTGQLNYIPIENLPSQENKLRSGDLIALVTDLKGLDVTHSGFLYRKGKSPAGLLHASQRSGIKISPNLERYVRGVDGAIGIIVARPLAKPPVMGIEQSTVLKMGVGRQ